MNVVTHRLFVINSINSVFKHFCPLLITFLDMDSSTEETPILPKQPAKRNEIRLGPKIQLEIFRFMSRRDLRRACRKVCFEWRDLIDENPNTLPLINVKPRQNHWASFHFTM